MREPAEHFLKDVQHHQMTIPLNEGVYRHVRFKQPGTSNMWFDLVTWPGFLTISGDMGTWTFSRVPDMFTFFRDDKLRINPSYWAEKLEHGNFTGREGGKIWDQDTFQAHLIDQLERHFEDEPKKLTELKAAVEEEIFRLHDGDGPHAMRHAAYEFTYEFEADRDTRSYTEKIRFPREVKKFQFEGMDLPDGMVYSYHFVWCLYAIVWGIQKWDNGDLFGQVEA
jgi:hypothetical protein